MKTSNQIREERARNSRQSAPNRVLETSRFGFDLGFATSLQTLVFVLCCACLFVSPLLFSNFWEVTHDLAPQSLFSALAAVVALLLALCPRDENRTSTPQIASDVPILSTRNAAETASANRNSRRFLTSISLPTRLLLAFFAWCVLSCVASVYWHDTLLEMARVLSGGVWFLVMRELLRFRESNEDESGNRVLESAIDTRKVQNSRDLRALLLLFSTTCGMVLVCVPALTDFLATRNPRQFGTFFNPNLFANAGAMTLPLALGATLGAWRFVRRNWPKLTFFVVFVGVVLSVLVFGGLVVTSSKGGFLAAIVALFVFAIGLWRAQNVTIGKIWRANRVLVSLILLATLGAGGALATKTVLPRLAQARGSEDNSTMFRAYTWKSTLKMAETRPILGWGAGGFSQAHDAFATVGTTRSAHQSWLQIAAEHGFPALVLLIAASALFLRRGWRALRTQSWPSSLAAMSAVVAFAVHAMTDAGWGITSILLMLMTAFALLDAGEENANDESDIEYSKRGVAREISSSQSSRLRWGWLAIVAIAGASSWVAQRASAGEDARESAEKAVENGDRNAALQFAQDAAESDPLSSRQQLFLAQMRAASGDNSGAETAFSRATSLDSWSSAPWRTWAAARSAKRVSSTRNAISTAQLWDFAVKRAPRETAILLARAKWRLSQNANDAMVQKDLETIVAERSAPYGKYAAVGDAVNLDFARAALLLTPRALKNGDKTRAQTLLQIAQSDIELAKTKVTQQQKMLAENPDTPSSAGPPADLDELQTRLETLKKEAQ